MSLTAIQPDVFAPCSPALRPSIGAMLEQETPFGAALRAVGSTDADAGAERERDARQVAEQLVATTFIEPVLTMMRETSTAAGPFAPSGVERRFAPMLDQHLSERIVHGSKFPLVDRITKDLLRADPVRADDWREARENQHDDA